MKCAEQPLNKALQQSNVEVINTLINISAFDIESIDCNLDIFLRWKNAVLLMLKT